MDASSLIGPAIGAGLTLVLLIGGYFLREGGRRQRLDDHDKRLDDHDKRLTRTESKHVKIAEHEIEIEELKRRTTTHKHDLKEEIDHLRRRIDEQ